MQIEHYIPKTVEEIFSKFHFSLEHSEVKHPRCIAYHGLVNDEVMVLYEFYVDNEPRFFGIFEIDHDDGDQAHTDQVFKSWSKSSDIKLIETVQDRNICYLYELIEPFGIHFSA